MNKSRATSCGPRLIQNLLVETPCKYNEDQIMGSLILSSSQDSITCGPRLIQNLLVETPLQIQ